MNAANDSQYKRRPEERVPKEESPWAIIGCCALSFIITIELLIAWGII